MPDGSWFDSLPSADDQTGGASSTMQSAPGQATRTNATPTMVVRPQGQTAASGPASASWFDALPVAAEDKSLQQPNPSTQTTTRPAWATGARSVSLDSGANQTPDLPEWAGGQGSAPPAQPQTATPPQQPSWSNLGNAIPSGLYSGVTKAANLPTDAVNAASGVMKGLSGQDYGTLKPPFNTNPTGYQPQGGWARGLHDASEAGSNMLAMGAAGRFMEPLFQAGSAPAIASHAIGDVSPGTVAAGAAGGAAEEPIARNVPEQYQPLARMGANVATGGLVGGIENAAQRGVSGSVSPETAQLAQLGRDTYDLPIRGGQISGNRMVRATDSVLKSVPMSGHGALDEEMQSHFNRAVAQTIGEDATKITPQVMSAARNRIGGVLQDVETRNPVNFDQPFINELAGIESNARSALTDPEYAVIKRQLDGVMSNVQPGNQVAGNTYGNLMHKGAPLDAAANSANPNVAGYASQIKDALRGSLQRSLSGDDLAAYQQARTQWKNMRTIEPLTLRADVVGGASPATGDIIPAQLRGVVTRSYGNSAFAGPGEIPLNDLASIGQRFLKEPPTSQTSERSNVMKWLERGGALAGAAVGGEHYLGLAPAEVAIPAAAAGAGTVGLARAVSSRLRSDSYAQKMIQKGLGTQGPQTPAINVPLVTSAGVRQLEPPEGPTTNPQTGMQQFDLPDAQAANKPFAGLARGLADGSISGHEAVKGFLDQNKMAIRKAHGGQALQNAMRVGASLSKPGTGFAVAHTVPEVAAAFPDRAALIQAALEKPQLAQVLAQPTGAKLSKPATSRLLAAIGGSNGDTGNPLPVGGGKGALLPRPVGGSQSAAGVA